MTAESGERITPVRPALCGEEGPGQIGGWRGGGYYGNDPQRWGDLTLTGLNVSQAFKGIRPDSHSITEKFHSGMLMFNSSMDRTNGNDILLNRKCRIFQTG